MTTEENFLRNREERAKARLAAGKGNDATDLYSEQRAALLHEIEEYTRRMEESLSNKDEGAAARSFNELRRLVQDAAATETLTSYEMAKANSKVSQFKEQLQRLGEPDVGGGNPGDKKETKKKFRFSAGATKRNPAATEEKKATKMESDDPSESPQGSQVAADGASYGPLQNTTACIPSARALFLRECEDSAILVLPIAGSAFVSECKNTKLYIASSQLRLKNCHNVEVYAWVASTPIIENCTEMRFGPYSCWSGLVKGPVPLPSWCLKDSAAGDAATRVYDSHRECVAALGEMDTSPGSKGESNWQWVEDFQWLKKTASPHWRTLEASEFAQCDAVFRV